MMMTVLPVPAPPKDAGLAAFGERGDQVNDLYAGFEDSTRVDCSENGGAGR
jgi:hypothetical protein